MQWVIKIGGSLYNSPNLVEWLNTLSGCGSQNIIIVPGGGPFADQIREADKQFSLDQELAHYMAVLAMQQYGYLMKSLCPKLHLVSSKQQLNDCWNTRKVAIWEPFDMVREHCKLEKTWDITSDSLAAWLANYLMVDQLLYVKSADVTLTKTSLKELLNESCIDPNLPNKLAEMDIPVYFIHKSHSNKFKKLLLTS